MRAHSRLPATAIVFLLAWYGVAELPAAPPAAGIDGQEEGDGATTGATTGALTAAAREAQVCGECHEDMLASAHRGPHAAIDRDPELAALHSASSSCAGCHGDGTAHLESGGEAGNIFAFGPGDSALVKSSRCLDCHADSHPRFLASPHAAAGLDCGSCHAIHGESRGANLLRPVETAPPAPFDSRLDAASASCEGCHGSVFAQFELNERHRLQEGVIGCTDCHQPHAPNPRRLLGGFKQQQCAECHVDKAGPFVFEHGAQRVEGCVACHTPHGAPSRHMLKFQSVADMCYSCHAAVPGFHTRFTSETVCTNCHSTIHGSNFDPAFLQ